MTFSRKSAPASVSLTADKVRLPRLDGSFPRRDNAAMPQYVHPAAIPYEYWRFSQY